MSQQNDPLAFGGQQPPYGQSAASPYGTQPSGVTSGYPAHAGYGMAPYLYAQQPRTFWKTWIVSLLLTIIPIVGSGMAIVYIYTRKRPHEYDGGEAAVAGLILLLNIIILAVVVYAVIALLGLTAR